MTLRPKEWAIVDEAVTEIRAIITSPLFGTADQQERLRCIADRLESLLFTS